MSVCVCGCRMKGRQVLDNATMLKEKGKGKATNTEAWLAAKKTVEPRTPPSSRNYMPPPKIIGQCKLLCNDNKSLAAAWDKVVPSYKDVITGEDSCPDPLLGPSQAIISTSHCMDEDVPMGTLP